MIGRLLSKMLPKLVRCDECKHQIVRQPPEQPRCAVSPLLMSPMRDGDPPAKWTFNLCIFVNRHGRCDNFSERRCANCGSVVLQSDSQCPRCAAKQPPGSSRNGEILIEAAAQGKTALVWELIDYDTDVNVQDKHGMTALMYAVLRGDSSMTEALLMAHAQPNIQNQDGATALMTAATQGDTANVKALLASGANPNICLPDGTTALYWARSLGHAEIVQLLKGHGESGVGQGF